MACCAQKNSSIPRRRSRDHRRPGKQFWDAIKNSKVHQIDTAVHAILTIPTDVAPTYRKANIKVFLPTSKNESQDARMIAYHEWSSTRRRDEHREQGLPGTETGQ